MRPMIAVTLGLVLCPAASGAGADDARPGPAGVPTPEQRLIGNLGTPSSMADRRAAMSPEQRLATTYMMGLVFQSSLKRCAIEVTGAQQAEIDAKLDALRVAVGPQMDEALREGLTKREAGSCSATEKAETTSMISDFIEKTPDDFAAGMEQR